jgi:hypothetical protein
MRQLTKSALSLGSALSLLGAKQAYCVIAGESGEDLFAPVTQMAAGQLDESMRNLHRSAESMESRVVDMAIMFMNPARWLNSESWNVWNASASASHCNPASARSSTVDHGTCGPTCCNNHADDWKATPPL